MTTVVVTLSYSLQEYLESQAAKEGLASISAYVEKLVQEDQTKKARADLNAKLREGLQAQKVPMTEERWQELCDFVLQRSPELAQK